MLCNAMQCHFWLPQAAQVQRGMESVKAMAGQVGQALEWTRKNQAAFEAQAAQLGAVASAKETEANVYRQAGAAAVV